jgi:hypothetical protein
MCLRESASVNDGDAIMKAIKSSQKAGQGIQDQDVKWQIFTEEQLQNLPP